MGDKKFYAVKKGVKPGIYKTWDECKANVHGFPGATYKGFKTLAEAEEFMGLGSSGSGSGEVEQENAEAKKAAATGDIKAYMESLRSSEAIAFVDGSFNVATGQYAYGMILLHNGEIVEQCEAYTDEEMATMRNVAGEVEGSKHAMQYCIDHSIESIDIYYDYEGIEKWALGMWKTNKEGTKAYKAYYDGVKGKLTVHFHKVKGHSGDLGNERADELAKKAAGI